MPRPPSDHASARTGATGTGLLARVVTGKVGWVMAQLAARITARMPARMAARAAVLAAHGCLGTLIALPVLAGPLEQRIGDRLQQHCATLTDPTARRECLTDLVAFRARHGLRTNPRRPAEEPPAPQDGNTAHASVSPAPAATSPTGAVNGGASATPATSPPSGGHGVHTGAFTPPPVAEPATAPALGNQGTLPPVQPILPLRIVQRRAIGYDAWVYRLSDGSVWEDVDGMHSRLRANALVRITESRFTNGRFMVASNERRRVRPLVCQPPANSRVAERCRALREGPLTF